MQVTSNLQYNTAFGYANGAEQLRGFAYASDRDLANIANEMASRQVNDKKHKRISNALWLSLPAVAGLGTVANVAEPLSKANKAKLFGKTAGVWAVGLGAIEAVSRGIQYLTKNNDKAKDVAEKHPILTFVGTLAASWGAWKLGMRGIDKLYPKIAPKVSEKLAKFNIAEKINNSKVLNKVSEVMDKVPSSAKNVAKKVLGYGPLIMMFTYMAHNINHEKAKNKVAIENYVNLKNVQVQVREKLDRYNA